MYKNKNKTIAYIIAIVLFAVFTSNTALAFDIKDNDKDTVDNIRKDNKIDNTRNTRFDGNIDRFITVGEDGILTKFNDTVPGAGEILNLDLTRSSKTITSIGARAFNETNIEGIVIPKEVTTIEQGAFHKAPNLKKVEFEAVSSLQTIEVGAFFGNKSLEKMALPQSLISIQDQAFEQCINLEEVLMQGKLTTIGSRAFTKTALTRLDIPDSVTDVGIEAFQDISPDNISKQMLSVNIGSGLTKLPKYMFRETKIKEITIPSTVKNIGDYAFFNAGLKSGLTIEEGVKTLGIGAFYGTEMKETTIPSSVTDIGEGSFEKANLSNGVTIKQGVQNIESHAFRSTELKEIQIPGNIANIKNGAFQSETITKVDFLGNDTKLSGNIFYNAGENLKEINFKVHTNDGVLLSNTFSGLKGTTVNLKQNYKDTVKGAPWGGTNLTINWKDKQILPPPTEESTTEENTETTTDGSEGDGNENGEEGGDGDKNPENNKPDKNPNEDNTDKEDLTEHTTDENGNNGNNENNENNENNGNDNGIISPDNGNILDPNDPNNPNNQNNNANNNGDMTLDKNGNILDKNGNMIGSIDENGNILDKNGNIIGSIDENGNILDENGNIIGYIDKYGNIILYDREMEFGDLTNITPEAISMAKSSIKRYIGEYINVSSFSIDQDLLANLRKGGNILNGRKTIKPGFGFDGELSVSGATIMSFLILLIIIIITIICRTHREMERRRIEEMRADTIENNIENNDDFM